ncbi:MAG: ribosome silencing factor [Clostridium sp.]|nr:ribosome silencing factor [Clostridium sp.]
MAEETQKLAHLIESLAQDKKAGALVVLEVGKVSLIADYFVIATGANKAQVHAIADHVMAGAKEAGYTLLHREGYAEALWVLLDYGSVVMHIFQPAERDFYNLERLWSHAPRAGIANIQPGKEN